MIKDLLLACLIKCGTVESKWTQLCPLLCVSFHPPILHEKLTLASDPKADGTSGWSVNSPPERSRPLCQCGRVSGSEQQPSRRRHHS